MAGSSSYLGLRWNTHVQWLPTETMLRGATFGRICVDGESNFHPSFVLAEADIETEAEGLIRYLLVIPVKSGRRRAGAFWPNCRFETMLSGGKAARSVDAVLGHFLVVKASESHTETGPSKRRYPIPRACVATIADALTHVYGATPEQLIANVVTGTFREQCFRFCGARHVGGTASGGPWPSWGLCESPGLRLVMAHTSRFGGSSAVLTDWRRHVVVAQKDHFFIGCCQQGTPGPDDAPRPLSTGPAGRALGAAVRKPSRKMSRKPTKTASGWTVSGRPATRAVETAAADVTASAASTSSAAGTAEAGPPVAAEAAASNADSGVDSTNITKKKRPDARLDV